MFLGLDVIRSETTEASMDSVIHIFEPFKEKSVRLCLLNRGIVEGTSVHKDCSF